VADSEKTHLIMQDCIISQFGKVSAGFEISESDVDPNTWKYLERNGMVKSVDSIVADADANEAAVSDVAETSTTAETDGESESTDGESSEPDEGIIMAVKQHLTEGKLQLKTLVQQTGISEDVLVPLLTEENGFSKNQQGWFSLI
jgi:hypothetical protein